MRVKLWAPSLHGCITNRCSYAHPMQSIVNFIILMVNLVTVPYHFFNICSTYSWTWSTRSWNDENCMTNYNIGRCCLCVCEFVFVVVVVYCIQNSIRLHCAAAAAAADWLCVSLCQGYVMQPALEVQVRRLLYLSFVDSLVYLCVIMSCFLHHGVIQNFPVL